MRQRENFRFVGREEDRNRKSPQVLHQKSDTGQVDSGKWFIQQIKFSNNIMMYEEMPAALSGAMGDLAYIARFPSEEEAIAFAHYALKRKEN